MNFYILIFSIIVFFVIGLLAVRFYADMAFKKAERDMARQAKEQPKQGDLGGRQGS